MKTRLLMVAVSVLALVGCASVAPGMGKRELMIVGNDEKQSWDEAGKPVFARLGKDT